MIVHSSCSRPVLVVGAGFAGCVIARQLAEAGIAVHVIDRRPHVGGNAYDEVNRHHERIHLYGPHLLHGDSQSVAIRWLSRFTEWTPYVHRVRALLADGRTTPLPVNQTTLEDVFGISLNSASQAREFLDQQVAHIQPTNTDEVFLANVGPRLADLFFRPYTRKMWGVDPSDLEAAIGARLPVRYNRDDRYFTDSFQAMPTEGYATMFQRILGHECIEVSLGQPYSPSDSNKYRHIFLGVSIDEYFDFSLGRLPYRSIRFESSETQKDQEAPVINYTDSGIYTRVTQWDLIGNSSRRQDGHHTVTREIPCAPEENGNERYYPVRNSKSVELYESYLELSSNEPRRTFIGRTGLFRYIDMVPCVTMHLQIAGRFLNAF